MATTQPTRADATRNRETILVAATRAFATAEAEPTMRAIAREAGVGVGTLYRHFPTRESLVAAVYADTLARLLDGAAGLLEDRAPADALRLWMDMFATWVATKRGMITTLLALIDSGAIPHADSGAKLLHSIDVILTAGVAAGDLRGDVSADDIAAGVLGILNSGIGAEQAGRLLDLLMDGLRPR